MEEEIFLGIPDEEIKIVPVLPVPTPVSAAPVIRYYYRSR
jgi:hypothetical protein